MKTKKLLSLLALLCLTVTSAWAQTWTNIIVNSDMEGTDVSCFYVHEQAGGMYLARIIDGIGVDGSRAIKLQSSDNEANSWDTQFNMRLPYVLPAGTQYKLSFDYKSDKKAVKEGDENGTFGFQVSNEPGQYVWWTLDGWPEPCLSVSESDVNKWLHFEETYTVPADCDGVSKTDGGWLMQFRTIYINLAGNKVATKFIIDNVKVEIPSDVLSTLTPEPVTDPGLMILAPPYNVTLAEGTEDAAKWTITPAEATTTGVDKDETVTLNYTGKKKVKSITITKKEAAAPAGKTIDLSQVTESTTAEDGDVLTGTLDGETQKYKISIADGATVTLDGATINGVTDGAADAASSTVAWAGLTCEGDATIIVKDGTTNSVTGFHHYLPGIYVPAGKTVTIKGETAGTGVLNVQGSVSAGHGNRTAAAGIGAGVSLPCGNIVIEGGGINATGGYACAAIGGAFMAACGDITITGGTVTASGSASAAGIGGGWYSTSGNILITGGTVNASSNEVLNTTDGGPGIGCGALCTGGNITIGGTAHVTAQGTDFAAGIGSGGTYNNVGSTCGNITIGGTANVTAQGGNGGAGIGTGAAAAGNSICGDILINGGTVTATAYSSAGIGSGINGIGTTCQCGTITITSDVTKVTATKGTDPTSLCSIGVGFYYYNGIETFMSTSGAVTIGGTVYWDGSAYQNSGDTYLTQSPLVYEP